MVPAAVSRRRRFDPDRRLNIATIALEVISECGVEGLTHRRVATAAGVPLGSMTYHFASLEDLLAVTIELAAARNREFWDRWSDALPPRPDLPAELTKLLVEVFSTKERTRSIVQLELYLASIRRPGLRAASVAWGKVVCETLLRHTDPATARTLSLMLDALAIESLIAGKPRSRSEYLTMFRRVELGKGAESPGSASPRERKV